MKDGAQTSIHMYTKDSHKLLSMMIVFLGILDFSNGEGGSSVGEGGASVGEGHSSAGEGGSSEVGEGHSSADEDDSSYAGEDGSSIGGW